MRVSYTYAGRAEEGREEVVSIPHTPYHISHATFSRVTGHHSGKAESRTSPHSIHII